MQNNTFYAALQSEYGKISLHNFSYGYIKSIHIRNLSKDITSLEFIINNNRRAYVLVLAQMEESVESKVITISPFRIKEKQNLNNGNSLEKDITSFYNNYTILPFMAHLNHDLDIEIYQVNENGEKTYADFDMFILHHSYYGSKYHCISDSTQKYILSGKKYVFEKNENGQTNLILNKEEL